MPNEWQGAEPRRDSPISDLERRRGEDAPVERGVSRRWCVPLAMLRDPADKLEGDSILAETPGDFGLLLWWL
ncbi:MAG: hypothetical protein LC667_20380, partial [Thioalkalivibrio sp.]|nr:hypothetical protein [Thioalkalivibrio sp.]